MKIPFLTRLLEIKEKQLIIERMKLEKLDAINFKLTKIWGLLEKLK